MTRTKKLTLYKKVLIKPTASFAFDPTFHKPDHFTVNQGADLWQPGVRWQAINFQGKHLGIKFVNKGKIDKPLLLIEVYAEEELNDSFTKPLVEELKYRFNLDLDLKPFYQFARKDKKLFSVIKKWRGMRPGHPNSLYEYLVIGVVLQNAVVRRSAQMFAALLHHFGYPVEFDSRKPWCFWSAGELTKKGVTEEKLRDLKLGYRAKFILKIDEQFAKGKVNEKQLRKESLERQKGELLKLYGVGPATVWYLLFDVFHRWHFLTMSLLGSRKFTPNCFLTAILPILCR